MPTKTSLNCLIAVKMQGFDQFGPQNYTNFEINFGEVAIGASASRVFPVKNSHYAQVTYSITRSTQTNPIYQVFDVNKYELRIEAGEVFPLKITYTPNVPGNQNFDYFKIIDIGRLNIGRICCRGQCIGPVLSCSVRYLNFHQTPESSQRKQIFQLTNNSTRVPAIYHFDYQEEGQGIFQVDPIAGQILPTEYVYVTVRFCPKSNFGFFSRQLTCLFLYHEPITINLFGIHSNKNFDFTQIKFRYYPQPHEDTVSYRGYLSDSVTFKVVPPPVSLSVNFLDFGRIFPETSCQTLTTSFTNHMDEMVEIEWESAQLFQIYPQKMKIPGKKSVLYECRFKPDQESRLSAAILHGHIMWNIKDEEETEMPEYTLNVPISLTMRLIGHSFPKHESWIPIVSITPKTVILPLTLPNFPTWTSFMIQVYGHLPVLYKLLPPQKTNFVMKPMVGLIRNYQIIAVQLQSNSMERTSFMERWNIELNGQEEKLLPIFVKAQTDLPFTEIGVNGVIEFEPMQPGTQTYTYAPMTNTSCCQIAYEFQPCLHFGIEPSKGILAPGEEIFLNCWYYAGIQEEGEKTFEVICKVHCIYYENVVIGPAYDMIIQCRVNIIYSELCALPNHYQCGEVEFDSGVHTKFYLFNFGQSPVNFKLCHNHNLKLVTFDPSMGRCGPREKILIKVDFIFRNLGENSLIISYANRVTQYGEETVVDGSTKNVFSIDYKCYYPTLQIVDLIDHSFGYLLTKDDLWDIFRINEINLALNETVHSEIRRVTLSVPQCERTNAPYHVIFLLKNVSKSDTTLRFKRRQMCDCKAKESKHSLTFRQKVIECPHKQILTLEIPNETILANTSQTMAFQIKYIFPGSNILSYILKLSNDRTVILNITIHTVHPDIPTLSFLSPDGKLNLGHIFIGLREAPIQALWLYNNTSSSVPFVVDDLEINVMCNEEGFTVLQCLNQTGYIKPRTCAPVLFRFSPIEAKIYKLLIPIMLGKTVEALPIEGYGIGKLIKSNFNDYICAPTNPIKNNLLHFSLDKIIVEPLMVSSATEKMFFIKNRTTNREIKYQWQPCFVDGLIKVVPLYDGGVLKPKETHSVILKITSFGEPCSIKLSLRCEFIDYTQVLVYQQSLAIVQSQLQTQIDEGCSEDTPSANTTVASVHIESAPEFLAISLPIIVNVIGALDQDTCLNVDDQMKQRPYLGVNINIDKFTREYYEKKKQKKERIIKMNVLNKAMEEVKTNENIQSFTKFAMECLVGKAVFTDYFMEIVKILKTESSPLYSQIKSCDDSNEVRRRLTQANVPEITDILLVDSLHETFHLGPSLQNCPLDIEK